MMHDIWAIHVDSLEGHTSVNAAACIENCLVASEVLLSMMERVSKATHAAEIDDLRSRFYDIG